jgi:hypothetical protein
VPYRLRKGFRKIHVRLVRELEKKFSGKVIKDLYILVLTVSFWPFCSKNMQLWKKFQFLMHFI